MIRQVLRHPVVACVAVAGLGAIAVLSIVAAVTEQRISWALDDACGWIEDHVDVIEEGARA